TFVGSEYYDEGYIDGMRDVLYRINQLDEAEVLSQEWLDENKSSWTKLKIDGYYIPVEKLQNLLVPKQEEPVIPKFVAEWYESEGKQSSWWNWFYKWGRDEGRTELETKTIRWMQDFNEEAFVNMFLHGYTVEKERKYYAKIKGHENILSGDCYWNYDIGEQELSIDNIKIYPDVTAEYMIKATKDEWANLGITDDNADFELVEELEE